jgi:hypothetical protein
MITSKLLNTSSWGAVTQLGAPTRKLDPESIKRGIKAKLDAQTRNGLLVRENERTKALYGCLQSSDELEHDGKRASAAAIGQA